MKLNCEKCLKNDVCALRKHANNAIESFEKNLSTQFAKNNGLEFSITCTHFVEQKILRGETQC